MKFHLVPATVTARVFSQLSGGEARRRLVIGGARAPGGGSQGPRYLRWMNVLRGVDPLPLFGRSQALISKLKERSMDC